MTTSSRPSLPRPRRSACALLVWLMVFASVPASAGSPTSLGAFVAASAGGHSSGGGYTLGFTIGEPVVGLSLAPSAPLAHVAGFWSASSGAVLGIGDPSPEPARLKLAIAPNPFAAATRIELDLPAAARTSAASVRLFDPHGRLVRAIGLPRGLTGRHSVLWDGEDHDGHVVPVGV